MGKKSLRVFVYLSKDMSLNFLLFFVISPWFRQTGTQCAQPDNNLR